MTKSTKRSKSAKSNEPHKKKPKLETKQDETNDKLNTVIDLVTEISHQLHYALSQVEALQKDVNLLKTTLSAPPPSEKSNKGPFPEYYPIHRTVPRPSSKEVAKSIGGKAHSLQFTSNLYVNLIEQAIGPASETGLDYKAMVKEAILITKAIVSHTKEENRLHPEQRWSQVDPTIKLNAYQRLEMATEHLLPLKTCSEFWGAHVLISNFWLKRKKTTSSSSEQQSRKSDAFSIPFLTNQ